MRAIAEAVLQLIMEADVEGLIGAGRHERAENRTTWRNGYRDCALDTRLGTLNLKLPNLRQGSYFPSFLEARKMSEQALVAVIQEAWIATSGNRRDGPRTAVYAWILNDRTSAGSGQSTFLGRSARSDHIADGSLRPEVDPTNVRF